MVYDRPHDPCKPQRPEYFAGFAGDITLSRMNGHSQPVALQVGPCALDASLVRLLRGASGAPVSEVASSLRRGSPVTVCHLFGGDHDQNARQLLELISILGSRGVAFQVFLCGRAEPVSVLKNLLESHRQISYDTRMEMDLESGKPSEDALRWASGNFESPRHDG
jgi:hypothetical protein